MEPPITNHESRDSSHEASATKNEQRTTNNETDEISLLDLLIVLAKHKWLVLGLPFVAAILAAIYSFTLPNIYTATTKILPPQQNQSGAAALAAQLGGLAGVAGVAGVAGGALGIRSSNDLYIAMLRSRVVADNLIQRFDLQKVYETRSPQGTRAQIGSRTNINSGKDGLVTIEFDDSDPKRAAAIANAYVDELYRFNQSLAVTEASQRRLFFEQQLLQAKDGVAKAEVAARRGLEQGGLVKVDDQGRAMVETTARLRAQMTVKEVQIGAMRTFAADRNPDLRLAQQELEAMKRELAKIEGTGSAKAAQSVSGGKGFENLHLLRDLKYYETIYELLAKQFEMAKIDEARDASLIQVLDKAIEPEERSKPKRRSIVLLTAVVAGFFAILLAFMKEWLDRTSGDPERSRRLRLFRSYLIGR